MRTTSHVIVLLGALVTAGACRPSPDAAQSAPPAVESRTVTATRDEHSYAEPDVVVVTHLALDVALDFDQKTLAGTATLHLNWKNPDATTLVLDSRQLRIGGAEAGDGTTWTPAKVDIAEQDPVLGSKVTVTLGRQAP